MRINPISKGPCFLLSFLFLCFGCTKNTIEEKPNTSGLTKSVDPWEEVLCAQEWQHTVRVVVYDPETDEWKFEWKQVQATYCHYVGPTAPDGSAPAGSGGGPNYWTNSSVVHASVAGTVITDIDTYLSCFNLSSSASLTVYVKQPYTNTGYLWNLVSDNADIGESFIEIQQGSITRVIGFYPSVPVYPLVDPEVPGVLIDKGNVLYDVGLIKGITGAQLTQIVNYIKYYLDARPDYHFLYNNNADFATDVANQGGFIFYNQEVEWPNNLGWGRSSAVLGQYLRYIHVNSAILTEGGLANTSSGTCP